MAGITKTEAPDVAMSDLSIKPAAPKPNPSGSFSSKPPPSSTSPTTGVMGNFALGPSSFPAKDRTMQRSKDTDLTSWIRQLPSPVTPDTLRTRFTAPLGNWSSFRWTPSTAPELIDFDLIPEKGYGFSNDSNAELDYRLLFESASALRSCIELKLYINPALKSKIPPLHHAAMAHAIYCSNSIERVGATPAITSQICHRVFAGEAVLATDVSSSRDDLYTHLTSLIPTTRAPTVANVIQSRREIIQHAQAMMFILNALVNADWPLTQEIIKHTHKILVTGLDIHDGNGQVTHKWEEYAGRYRSGEEHVSAGLANFVAPSGVAKAMRELCGGFERDMKGKEQGGSMDPCWVASRWCKEFVIVHPFLDGNGRMGRLILNALLMKYLGCVVGIGGSEAERGEYSRIFRRPGEEIQGWGELAGLVLRKVEEEMGRMEEAIDETLDMP